YDILEKDVIPLFYDVEENGLPRRWIEKMKLSMSRIVPIYNTHRMVHEYYNDRYSPAIKRYNDLKADKAARTVALALWKQKIAENWAGIRIMRVDADSLGPFKVGDKVKFTTMIVLGNLKPEDVCVELLVGMVDASGMLFDTVPVSMEWKGSKLKGQLFEGIHTLTRSGKIGYNLRVLPYHPDMVANSDMMLIKWAQ
ncbi:MAG: alpha-glucan phosphorylase, partial [Candidatus Latescibacterota bacterium]